MGLYDHPVLMAVDMLIMESDVVPVGQDQVRHVEYGRRSTVVGESVAGMRLHRG